MEKIMAVITLETDYSERFCSFVNRKNNLLFTAVPFKTLENCVSFGKSHNVNIVICDEVLLYSDENGLSCENFLNGFRRKPKLFILSDNSNSLNINNYENSGFYEQKNIYIWKYQSADTIMHTVFENCGDIEMTTGMEKVFRSVNISGIFGLSSGSDKTEFALVLGSVLNKRRKTLYINFDEFTGLGGLFGRDFQSGLSTTIYYLKQQGGLNRQRLESGICNLGGLDCIPPAQFSADLQAATADDYASLILEICKNTEYENIVVELSLKSIQSDKLMNMCNNFYLICGKDEISKFRTEEFENYLNLSGRKALKERSRRVYLPPHESHGGGDNFVKNLLYGSLGDYVKSLVTENNSGSERRQWRNI